MLKTIVMQPASRRRAGAVSEARWVLAVVRGDHEVNEGKVRDAVGFAVRWATRRRRKDAGFAIGYVSPRRRRVIDGACW
jgi:hypothetical protein